MVTVVSARPAPPPRVQVVTFCVGGERCAADVFAVERVLPYASPRPLANAPGCIKGVVEHDGGIVPVLDLRTRLGIPPSSARSVARTIVFAAGGGRIAAAVDTVDAVEAVDVSAIEDPPQDLRGDARQFVRGIIRRGDSAVTLLDVPRLLDAGERLMLDHAMMEEGNGR